ncbi:hypothetical protein HDZ31DRAFT_41860 [Schizophyllum fasciatum]
MTGDDSFHAHCFTCKVCKNRIDDLVFAKTSQGIYCMKCHNDRMIRIRKHTQRKAERERAAGGSGNSKSRERPYHREGSTPISATEPFDRQRQATGDRSTPVTPSAPTSANPMSRRDSANATPPAVTVAPPQDLEDRPPVFQHPPMHRTASASSVETSRSDVKRKALPAYAAFAEQEQERSGYATKPLHIPNKPSRDLAEGPANSLTPADDARRNKRRSINPGLSLSNLTGPVSPPQSSPSLSPLSASFPGRPSTSSRSPTPPSVPDHSSSSRTPSPSPSQFHTSPTTPSERTLPLTPDEANDRTAVLGRPPLLHSESSPAAPHLHHGLDNARSMPDVRGKVQQSLDDSLSPTTGLRQQRSFDERSMRGTSPGPARARSGSHAGREDPTSPSHRVDVPMGIESGTDTEAEAEGDGARRTNHSKASERPIERRPSASEGPVSPDSASEDLHESTPVERTSIATYIAPALPPIRFSMNTADFAELFSGMSKGGSGSMSTADLQKKLAMLAERTDSKDAAAKPESRARSGVESADAGDEALTPTSGTPHSLPQRPSTAHGSDSRHKAIPNGASM